MSRALRSPRSLASSFASLLIFVLGLFGALLPAQAGPPAPLPIPNVDILTNGTVNAINVQGDGKILIGGLFTKVNGAARQNLARLNADGTLDTGFVANVDGQVNAIASNASHVYVGGFFYNVQGVPRASFARLAVADGALDTGFNLGLTIGVSGVPEVRALAMTGTALYVGGTFNSIGGASRLNMARITTTTGTVHATFIPDANAGVNAIVPDGGNIYVGGEFTFIGGQGVARLARVSNSTGEADPLFAFTFNNPVYSLTLSGTDLYAGGTFNQVNGNFRQRIAKFSTTTNAFDPTFDASSIGALSAMNVRALAVNGSDLFAAGDRTASVPTTSLIRLNPLTGAAPASGWTDAPVATDGRALAVVGTDLLFGGRFKRVGSTGVISLARVSMATGIADAAFQASALDRGGAVYSLAKQPDGKLLVAGDFVSANGLKRLNAFRMNTDGTVDPAWVPDPDNVVYGVEYSSSGIFLAGDFGGAGGAARPYLALVDGTTGAAVTAFNAQAGGRVWKTAVDGSSVFAVGDFFSMGGITSFRLAKLDIATGGTAAGWITPSIFSQNSDGLFDVKLDSTGAFVYIAGSISKVGYPSLPDVNTSGVAMLQRNNGQPNGSFLAQFNFTVYAIATSPDGTTVYAAGGFNQVGGVPQRCVAAISASGGGRLNFAGETNGSFCSGTAIAATSSAVYLGGALNGYNGSRFNLVKLGLNGTLDSTFQPDPDGFQVNTILPDGPNVMVGGAFSTIGGQPRTLLASLPPLPTTPGQPNMTDATDSGLYNNDNVTNFTRPTFTGTCALGDTVRLRVDGSPVLPTFTCTTGIYTVTPDDPIPAGIHTVSAIASSNGLDSAPSGSSTIIIMTVADTSITSAPPSTTTNTSASFNFTSPDPDATFECSLDGAAFSACFPPQNYSGLAIGARTFRVRATDLAGNLDATPAQHDWTIEPIMFTLSVAKGGTGSGTVSSSPAGISCGTTCDFSFATGTLVVLAAAPSTGSNFSSWTGCPLPSGDQCTITVGGALAVTANFVLIPSFSVSVIKSGGGSGIVTSSPAGIDCGATCTGSYALGTMVTLTAAPGPGSTFGGWTNCPAVLGANCSITVTSASNVTATFNSSGAGNPALPDFNADGKPDIIWSNTASGATYLWRMNGPTLISDSFYATIDPSWKIQGVADFNGDGHPDIVWRNTANGACYVWYTVNGVFTGTDAFLFSLPPEWVIQGVADFNADGKPDFLMRNSVSGNAFAWFFNNAAPIGDQFLFNVDPSWKVEAVGDLNADGQPDLLFRSMTSGLSFAWNTNYVGGVLSLGTSSPMIYSIDPVWEVVQLADWNGDGKPDLLFRNAATGLVFVWYLDGVTLGGSDFVFQIDPSWEIVPRR